MRRLASFVVLLVAGCATYHDELAQGQSFYSKNQYDQALSVWRILEPNMDSLGPAERSQYAYFRGMTDYRLGMRQDSRHWLAIAKANNEAHPGGLDETAAVQLDKILVELNEETYKFLPGK